ncbi:nucleoside hydrolase [Lysobacter korlensis]|uniref:Nucleoside hydrolase n=1 Tax=Lysobacter korlensis TaxID=553636 RepID=A0ABV6S084_9GAMM
MPATRSLVIDTDTASDDAVAILLALRHPDVAVRAITVVGGNVPLPYGTRNAAITLELVGATVPLYAGCEKPLLRRLETAQHVHGADGMSGVAVAEPSLRIADQHAVLALLEIARTEPGRHDLVTLGPLTNIATALSIDPSLLTRFRHTYMMVGAADGRGNVSPAGEYNAWADPEAAEMVFKAAGFKTMIGWDVSRKYAVITPSEDRRLRSLGRLGAFAAEINQAVFAFATEISGTPGYDLPDPISMAVAIDPTLITEQDERHLAVSMDPPTRGLTFADYRRPLRSANTRVVTGVDGKRFKEMLFTMLAEGAER